MKISADHIRHIRVAFGQMKTKEELLALLNYAKEALYGEKAHPIGLQQLTWYAHPNLNRARYRSFEVPKKKPGSTRAIHAPVAGLKAIQRALALILQCVYEAPKAATAFNPGTSIVANAGMHTGNWYVYNLDFRDFFTSIDQARVWKCLQIRPFNLKEPRIASMIAALCCTQMEVSRLNDKNEWEKQVRNVVPQGAPTSPVISNIVCQKLDFLLSAVARKFGAKYSRYADDVTFSSLHNIYQPESTFLHEIHRIITEQRFYIKPEKTRLQKQGYRQEVTGLIINEKVNVTKRYIKEIRRWLYYWERYGYGRARSFFEDFYAKDKNTAQVPEMARVLHGKLNFLQMVRGEHDGLTLRLQERYRRLVPKFPVKAAELSTVPDQRKLDHEPQETVAFLKYFKYDNEFSFKQLVHRPIDYEDFDYARLIEEASSQFVSLSQKNGKRLFPHNLTHDIAELFVLMRKEGVSYYEQHGKHPMEDKEVGGAIQDFKRKYRFGNERTESSILSELIINTAKSKYTKFDDHDNQILCAFNESDTSGMFRINQLVFMPNLEEFQGRANFFTWVPNVRRALSIIFDGILKHSNIRRQRPFAADRKKIVIDIRRFLDGDDVKIELSILDKFSVFKGNIDSLLEEMQQAYFLPLGGVCDFRIEVDDLAGNSHACVVLPYKEQLVSLSSAVGGFKFIFTFYD
jgi:hypothetical protein